MKSTVPALLLLLLASTVSAEIYQWKDENGKIHFSDSKPGHDNYETLRGATAEEQSSSPVPAADKSLATPPLGISTNPSPGIGIDRGMSSPVVPTAPAGERTVTTSEFYKKLEVKPQGAGDRLQASARYSYYDIAVWKVSDIVPSAFRTSPITESGKKYLGHTEWEVRWDYRTKELDDNTCRLETHTIDVRIHFRMPRLFTRTLDVATDNDVHRRWQEYYRALAEHEKGHMENGLMAANRINDFFNQLYSAKYKRVPCSLFPEWMADYPNRILKEHQAWDGTYDKDTGHGLGQGADLGMYFPEK